MAPGTNIGAAHPVSGIGQMDEVMSKKVDLSDAAAYIRSKAERRGRNVEMAEKAVRGEQVVHRAEALDAQAHRPRGQGRRRARAAWRGARSSASTGARSPCGSPGHALTAVAHGLAPGHPVRDRQPEILFLLLLGALAGLGAEISHPGCSSRASSALLCLVLFLFASQIIPVNWAGVLLDPARDRACSRPR